MSGTSLDGIDLAYVEFLFDGQWQYRFLECETVPYDLYWQELLKNLVDLSPESLSEIDVSYTRYLSEIIRSFMAKHTIAHIDAICSHGHTALHQPQNRLTYQIGNRPESAKHIGQKVVCDFRSQDVALGGQGAPLVPIGDRLLFGNYDFCLNLGGFANISTEKDGKRIAFDICPVNIVLNHYANKLGKPYDENGRYASQGTVNEHLLERLNTLPFYRKTPPKSLGLEWVREEVFPILEQSGLSAEDVLATFTRHIALQVRDVVGLLPGTKVLVTGGGAYNAHLLQSFRDLTACMFVVPSSQLVEFKEAMVFGFLGVLRLRGETNCLKSVTGASIDHCSGKIYQP